MFKKHVAISKELDCAVQVDTRVHVRACVKTSYSHSDHLLVCYIYPSYSLQPSDLIKMPSQPCKLHQFTLYEENIPLLKEDKMS